MVFSLERIDAVRGYHDLPISLMSVNPGHRNAGMGIDSGQQ
jgi:hypothetical protein